MTVTKMIKSPHIEDRYILQFDDGSSMKIHINLIADFSLFSGRELSEEEYSELKEAAEKTNAKSRALRIIGSRAMSKGEIRSRLVEKGESEETAEETAGWLEDIGAVNDKEYAAMIVRHYSGKGYGEGKIKNELYMRKVPRELWSAALEEIPEDTEGIDKIVRMRLSGKEDDPKAVKKVTDMLLRRGFSWEQVKSALRRFEYEVEDFD